MYGYDYDLRLRRERAGRHTPWAGTWGYPRGYDRDLKRSRWQVDNGDPFGDRRTGTPVRMLRSRYRDAYDQRLLGYDRGYLGTYRARAYNEWFF